MSSDTNRQRLRNCQQDQSNGNPSKPSDFRDRQKTSRKDQKRKDNFRRFAFKQYTRSFSQSATDRKSFTVPHRQVPQYTPPTHLTGAYRDALFEGPRRMSKDYMPLYRTTYKRFFSEMDTAQRMKCIASRTAQNTVNLTTSGQTTVESISDSVKSLQTTEQSLSDSVNSLQTTEEPVSDSVKSLQTTEEPVSDNMKFVQTTEQSVSDSVQSVQTTEQSVSDSVKSVHTTEQSVSDNMKFVQTIVESVSERTKPGRQSFCSRVMTDGEEMNSMTYADSNSIHNDAGRNAQLRYPEMSNSFRKEAVKRLVTIIELTIKENVHELAMITGCSIQMVDLFRELTGQTVADLLHNESVIVQTILLSVNNIDDSEKSQSRASAVYRAFDWLYECAIALVSRKKMSYLSGRRDALSQTIIDILPELLQITLNRVIRHLFYSRRVPSHVYQSKGRDQQSEEILTQLDTIIASFPAADSYSILTKRFELAEDMLVVGHVGSLANLYKYSCNMRKSFSNQDKEDASSSNEGGTSPRLFNNDHGTTPHAKNSMTEIIPRNMSKWTFHFLSNANNRLPPSLSFPLKIKDHSFSNIAESNIPVTAPLSFTNIHEPTLHSYDKAPKTVPRSCSYEHEVSVPSYSKASETTSQSFSNTGSARPYSCAISHESEPHTCRNILDTTLYAFNKAPVITQQSYSTLPQSALNSHYESHQSLPQSVSCIYEDAPSSVSNTIEKGHTSVRKSLQTVSYSSNNTRTQTNESSPLCDTFATAASILSGTEETGPSLFDVLPTDEFPTLPKVKPEKYSDESAKESNFVVKNVTSISEDDFARMLTIHGGKANKLDATEFSEWQQTTDVVGHAKIKIEPRDEVSDFQHDINECSVQVKENPCSYNMPFMSKHLYANESFLLKPDSHLESSTELNVVSDDQGKITNPDYEVMYPQLTSILNEDDAVTDTSRKSTMLQVDSLETRIKGLDVTDFENTDAWSKNRTLRSVIAVADQNVSLRVDSGLNKEYLRTKFNKSDVGSLVGSNPHESSRRDVYFFPVPCNSNATYTYAMKRPTTAGTLGICQGTQGISCGENGSLDPNFQETKEADAKLMPLFNRGSRNKTRQRYRRLRRKAETREYRSVDIVAKSNKVVETTRKTFGKSTGNSKCSNAERKEMVDGNGDPKRHRDRNVMKRAKEKILSTDKIGRNTSRAKGSEDGRTRHCDEQNLLSVKWRTNEGLVMAGDINYRNHAFPSEGKDEMKTSFAENEYLSRESKCCEGRNWTKEPKRGKCNGENGDSVPKIYERGNVCEDIENPALKKPERGKTNDYTTESALKKPERGKTNDDTTESVLKKPERGKTNDGTTESVLKKPERGKTNDDTTESVLKKPERGKTNDDTTESVLKKPERGKTNDDTTESVLKKPERGKTNDDTTESVLKKPERGKTNDDTTESVLKKPERGKTNDDTTESVLKKPERGKTNDDTTESVLKKPERGKTNDDTTESVLKKPERGKTNDDTTESVLKKPERGKTNDDTTESVLKKKRKGEIIEDNGESVLKKYEMGKSHKDYEEPASKELRRENPNEDNGKSVLGTYERGRTTEYNGESILAWLEGLCTAIEDINEPIQVSQGPTHAEIDRSDQLYSIISHDNDILSITTGQDSVFSEHKDCLNAVVYETHQTEEQQEENQKAIKQEVLCTTHAMNTEAPLLSPIGELQTDDNEDKTIHEIPDLFAETDLTPEYTLCSNYKQKQIDEMSFEGDKARSNASTLINLESTSNDSKQVSKMPEQEDVDEEKRIMQSLYRDSMMAKNESFSHVDQRRTNVWTFSQPDGNGSQVGLMANKNVIVEMKGTGMEPNFNAWENGHEGFSDGSIYDVDHEECSKTSDFKITRKIEGDGCYVNSEITSGIKKEKGSNVSIQDEILLDIQNLFLSALDMTEKLMDCSKEKSNNSKVVSENYKNGDYSSREQSIATLNFSFQNSFIKEVSSVGVSSDEVTEGRDNGARLMSDVSGHGCEVGHDTTAVLAEDAVPDKLEELQVIIKFYQLRRQIHICEEQIAVGKHFIITPYR